MVGRNEKAIREICEKSITRRYSDGPDKFTRVYRPVYGNLVKKEKIRKPLKR